MEINNILEKMSGKVDKSKNYLKGLFNASAKEYDDQFGDALSDDRKAKMSLIKIGKKYGLVKEDIDSLISEIEDEIINDIGLTDDEAIEKLEEYLPDVEDDEPALEYAEEASFEEYDDVDHGESGGGWERFLSTIPDPTKPKVEYEKTPSLIVEIGATYYLKLTNPKEVPYSHEFDGKFGLYTKHAFKVTLIKVSDEDLYDEIYKFGDFEGQPAFVNGKNYTLWLDDKAVGHFKMFWKQITESGLPDDRTFTYKFSKKGRYNIYTFKLKK